MRRQLPDGTYRWLGAGAATPRGEELSPAGRPRPGFAAARPTRTGRKRPRHVVR